MKNFLNCVFAAAAGATAMYYFDPDRGRRRRALLRDKMVAGQHDAERFARTGVQRASDELRGMAAEAKSMAGLTPAPTDDRQITEQVRAKMGRIVSHPGAINVTASSGRITLSGHILTRERDELVSAVAAMNGVHDVNDQMQAHDEPGNVPELQRG